MSVKTAQKKIMPENLMNSNHKAVSDRYRDGWDRIWGYHHSFECVPMNDGGGYNRIWGESIPMRIKRITLAVDRAVLELGDKKETPLSASGGGERVIFRTPIFY